MRCFYCGRPVTAEHGQVRRAGYVRADDGRATLRVIDVAHALCAAPAVTGGWRAPWEVSR